MTPPCQFGPPPPHPQHEPGRLQITARLNGVVITLRTCRHCLYPVTQEMRRAKPKYQDIRVTAPEGPTYTAHRG